MAKSKNIPIETLRQLLDYNPDTGEMFWKCRPLEMFSNLNGQRTWNGRNAGRRALNCKLNKSKGYLYGTIFSKPALAHRVIWALHYGEWPDQIDHVNHIGSDNRIVNLRSVSNAKNAKNMPLQKRNASGTCGVRWRGRDRVWVARIFADGKEIYLGSFSEDKKAEAVAARKAAEIAHGFHPNHGMR